MPLPIRSDGERLRIDFTEDLIGDVSDIIEYTGYGIKEFTSLGNSSGSNFEHGWKFKVQKRDLVCYGLRVYLKNSVSVVAKLWTANGTQLANCTINGTADSWASALFETPLPLMAGKEYVASLNPGSKFYSISIGNLTFNDYILYEQSLYGTENTFPATNNGATILYSIVDPIVHWEMGNEANFVISFDQWTMVPGGTLETVTRYPMSIDRYFPITEEPNLAQSGMSGLQFIDGKLILDYLEEEPDV